METLETQWKPELGNTKTNSKRAIPSDKWCFTYNNYTESELDALVTLCKMETFSYVIGREIGKQGTKHLQGYINFHKKVRPVETTNLKKAHWEKCKGTEEDNIQYCTKDNDFLTNFAIKKTIPKGDFRVIKDESMLRPWQAEIIKILETIPHNRWIYWFWEAIGNIGKTSITEYMIDIYGAVPVEGKKNDILFCAAEHESMCYIFDFERSMEEYISYGAIEKIKNGTYMCSKYESKPIRRHKPHVIIFANFPPDVTKLSQDRWKITEL